MANYLTRKQIQDDCEIEPARHHPNGGDITDPGLVRPGRFELEVEQIRCHWQTVAGIGCAADPAPVPGDNARRLHHTGDPLPSALAKLAVNPRAVVSPSASPMDFLNLIGSELSTFGPRSRTSRGPASRMHSTHSWRLSELGKGRSIKDSQWVARLLRADEQEPHLFSFARKDVAFLGCRAPSAVACSRAATGPILHAPPGSEPREGSLRPRSQPGEPTPGGLSQTPGGLSQLDTSLSPSGRCSGHRPVNQLDHASLEFWGMLPSLSLRDVHLQAHYRAKSDVYKSGAPYSLMSISF